ncbi:MAG: PGPGW domain-containing protein [Elusimicrobia bacterium]|nr:PGPGW domain-containing protein [Elusimicrobiota bacterium]
MRTLKRWCILTLGWLVVIVGIILIPAPGPGILVVMAGVMILSLKSARARWLLLRCKTYIRSKRPDVHARLERFRNEIRRWKKDV